MKKIFLLISIAASSVAVAQQQDVFDIQKHLQKKQLLSKVTELKNNFTPLQRLAVSCVMPSQNLSYTLDNGDKVMYGNGTMPCVKPGKQVHTMPGPVTADQLLDLSIPAPGQIPNAGIGYKR
jgi:hypothetical protein